MSTDPIKLVKSFFAAKPADTASKAPSTTTPAKAANTSISEDYKLSQSLVSLMAQGPSGSSTPDLSNYTAQGLKDSFQAAHNIQNQEKAAAAAATAKPLDDVLKTSVATGTNNPTPSAQAAEILKDKKATATDTGLAAIDSRLAQTVGISKAIGSA